MTTVAALSSSSCLGHIDQFIIPLGIQNGFWINFGSGWSHLANDDFSQILTGASQRIYFDTVAGNWKLVIEATMFVTYTVVNVWTGIKQGGNDPTGQYARLTGCDPTATLAVEAH